MAVEKKSVPMKEQPVEKRIHNFNEVPLGYTEEEAIREGERCLQCKKRPCVDGCPVFIAIPDFIKAIVEKDHQKAYDIIYESDFIPAVTGRVCPQEQQCQLRCVVGKIGDPVEIGKLERFASDWYLEKRRAGMIPSKQKTASNGKRVAIVGSGPAGLTCASELIKKGYRVTVFEGFHKLGGVLVYGIPEFRLPKKTIMIEIDGLKDLGVEFVTNTVIGRTITVKELFEDGYEAVFLGTGAGLPKFMNIPGENLNGIYSANEFLTRVNLMKAYLFPEYDTPVKRGNNVAVIGGGNVAMDAARTAIRLGAEMVYLIYRRSEVEMPARNEEIERAKEEGINFNILTNPVKYIGDENGFVKQMECVKMELGEPDASNRRRPIVIPGSEFIIDIDEVIVAIGTTPNPIISMTTPDLKIQKWGGFEADDWGKTSIPGVFAGGDAVSGAATVITAMGAGKKSAEAIDAYLGLPE